MKAGATVFCRGLCLSAMLVSAMGFSVACAASIDPAAAARYSDRQGGQVLLVERSGRMLLDHRAPGIGMDSPFNGNSLTKSLVALGVLAAEDGGLLHGPSSAPAAEPLSALLRQTAGLPPSPHLFYGKRPADKSRDALKLAPGPEGTFEYGPAHYERVVAEMERAWGSPKRVEDYFRSKILAPLGMGAVSWQQDHKGSVYGSAGMEITPHGLLSAGRLIARNGRINFFQRVIPESGLRRALTGSDANPAYGMGFWLNHNAAKTGAFGEDIEKSLRSPRSRAYWQRMCLSPLAPPDLVAMAGSGGLRVYVVPSMRLVVVRLGKKSAFSDPEFLASLFSGRASKSIASKL